MSHRTEPVCRNQNCPCAQPGPICEEHMQYHGPYCARCGWQENDHKDNQ